MWPFSQRDLNGKSGRCCAFGNGYHTIGGHVAATLGAAAHGSPRACGGTVPHVVLSQCHGFFLGATSNNNTQMEYQ